MKLILFLDKFRLCQKLLKENNIKIIQSTDGIPEGLMTILFGKSYGIQKFIQHVQRLALEKNYSKLRILTQQDEIPIMSIQKKFPFYLVEKIL